MINLLLDSELDAEQYSRATTAKQSADALLVIINDILDFSKIEAGKLILEETDFDIDDLMEDVAATLTIRAEEKGVELTCAGNPTRPTRYNGDPGRIRQVVMNLVGNAIKFTDAGQISVHYDRVSEEGGRCTLRFTVTDTGIGLAKDQCEKMFRKFSQADASTTRKYGGTWWNRTRARDLQAGHGIDGRGNRRDEPTRRGVYLLLHGRLEECDDNYSHPFPHGPGRTESAGHR